MLHGYGKKTKQYMKAASRYNDAEHAKSLTTRQLGASQGALWTYKEGHSGWVQVLVPSGSRMGWPSVCLISLPLNGHGIVIEASMIVMRHKPCY